MKFKYLKTLLIPGMILGLTGCSSEASSFELDPTTPIAVSGGEITGTMADDESVAIYKGIPYAAAPVGDLRWQAPQAVTAWDGVKECTDWGASAIQPTQAPFRMWSEEFIIEDTGYSEDSLSLNIWAKTDGDSDKPVLVYIHGGGFSSGGSSCEVYDGEYMAEQDVVYVSINYRVGIMGFLAHPDLSAESPDGTSGNYGLMDQIAALEWVQDNIDQFGGDASNVTIMGQSAGSAAVNCLVNSPKAAGLFDQAVSMSYNLINSDYATLAEKEAEGKELFGDMTLEQMRAMTPDELLALGFRPSPILDGNILEDNYFANIKAGNTNDVTLMSGIVDGDVALFGSIRSDENGAITVESFNSQLATVFGDDAQAAMEIYPATEDNVADLQFQVNSDIALGLQNVLAKTRAISLDSDTYLYNFSHIVPGPEAAMYGAFHTGDVPYFLNIFSDLRADYWQQEDYDLGQLMSSYLINFVTTGNPNGDDLAEWSPSDADYKFMNFDSESNVKEFDAAKVELYDNYFDGMFDFS